jgi:hypothetical protein
VLVADERAATTPPRPRNAATDATPTAMRARRAGCGRFAGGAAPGAGGTRVGARPVGGPDGGGGGGGGVASGIRGGELG